MYYSLLNCSGLESKPNRYFSRLIGNVENVLSICMAIICTISYDVSNTKHELVNTTLGIVTRVLRVFILSVVNSWPGFLIFVMERVRRTHRALFDNENAFDSDNGCKD